MKKYIINVLSYLWVWFIWWSISHWFFSGTKSIIMAALGIVIFLTAEFLKEWEKDYINTIVFGLFYSLCIGMISGWFQHFLDSPQRSIYILPIWFVIWYIIYIYKENKGNFSTNSIWAVIAIGVMLFGLWTAAYKYLPSDLYSSVGGHHEEAKTTDTPHEENNIEKKYSDLWYSWMSNKTNEQIKEHCQMMPSMEWCTEISKTNTSKSENPTNINNTGATNHEMNHADMVNSVFDFVYLMIPHHQEAVDTSKILLQTTKNPELIKLANNIIASQDKEINMMKWRISNIYSGNIHEWMWYMLMMRPTSGLETDQIDLQRAQDMIKHHQWALDMSNKLIQIMEKEDPVIKLTQEWAKHRGDLRNFANAIITSQTKEIQDMKNIISQVKKDDSNNANHH